MSKEWLTKSSTLYIKGVKMKEHDSKIALRLPNKERQQIKKLVKDGKFKNISQVIRQALKEFLSKEGEALE